MDLLPRHISQIWIQREALNEAERASDFSRSTLYICTTVVHIGLIWTGLRLVRYFITLLHYFIDLVSECASVIFSHVYPRKSCSPTDTLINSTKRTDNPDIH